MKTAILATSVLLGLAGAVSPADSRDETAPGAEPATRAFPTADAPRIVRENDAIRIVAGALERVIRVSGGNVATERLAVSGLPLLGGRAAELSFRVSRAAPNRKPLAWVDDRSFSADSWGQCFESVNVTVAAPKPGTQRLLIRARSLKDPVLAGVSVNLIYEVYRGYPVIRKWVEIHNNGSHWLRLDNLTTDDVKFGSGFGPGVPLTPSERGAVASIIAFSSADRTKGVIVASEVPSALRAISAEGASGYNPEHFEWIIGPAESFVSEPTFLYGFSGRVFETPSAESLPLDRAVEGRFKEFLREHLGIAPVGAPLAAPVWCSWANFGPALSDAIVRQQADLAARCGFAVLQLDDGWQKGRLGTRPDEKTFPRFDETCDYVRGKGLRLGLWVSCFRDRDAPDFQALPDAASAPEIRRLNGVGMSFASPWRHYYANDLVFLRDRYGATYFKQDFSNIKFGDTAAGHDSRSRKESLLRGLRGLLESQDLLRHLAPDVANEITHEIYWDTPGTPCDLAVLKHALLYHVPPNDYSGCGHPKQRPGVSWNKLNPDALRAELVRGCSNARVRFYAHRGLPLECVEYFGAATVNWKGSLTSQVQDRQICSWLMGAPAVYTGDLASLSEENIARYRSRFDLLKRLEATCGIYRRFQYSGVPAPTDSDWHWWGKLDEKGCGAVVVVRGSGGNDLRAVNIPWVDPAGTYKVAARLQAKELGVFTGTQLQDGKLLLALPLLGQEILELSRSEAD